MVGHDVQHVRRNPRTNDHQADQDRHHVVADMLVDCPAVAFDDAVHRLEVAVPHQARSMVG